MLHKTNFLPGKLFTQHLFLVKKQIAHPLRKSSLFLLAVFLLPPLAKEVHTFFPHHSHDHHHHHCGIEGVHIHDPEHYTPDHCPVCALVQTQFFNDACLPLLATPTLVELATVHIYKGQSFKATHLMAHPRGPPVAV